MIISHGKGFSLIEIIVLLTIIAVLALIATPLFTTTSKYRQLSMRADELYTALRFARSEAIKQNVNVYVSFNTGDTWCYGINTGSACNCTIPSGCDLKTVSYSKAQLLNLTNTFTGNTVYFEGSHGSASASGSVTLTIYGSTPLIKMSVTRLGNVQICSTGITGYSAC